MTRSDRCAAQYKRYYDELYPIAAEENEATAEKQAAVSAFRLMCETDLYFLATEVFGMDRAKNGGRKIWYEPIHGLLCDLLQNDDDSLIWMSRHMLKTTVSSIWCVQQILRDPTNVAIGLWSMSSRKAESILKTVKTMLLHPKLVQAYPDRIPPRKKWERDAADALTLTRDVPGIDGREFKPNEEQIEVAGLDTNVTGRHYTHHYLDDIITDKNTTTAVQIEKAIDQYSAIAGLKGITTVEKIIGTPWHSLDLYHYIIENNLIPRDQRIHLAGVHLEGEREVIDYPWYTRKFLEDQRKKMRHLYWPQLHLDTRPREDRIFVPPYPEWTTWPEEATEFYMACDPSTGRSERHDKSGLVVGAVDPENTTALWLIEAESHTLLAEELATLLVEKIIQYRPKRLGIELGLQAGLLDLLRLKAQEKEKLIGWFPMPHIHEIKTGGGEYGKNKTQKIDNTLGAMLRDKRVFLHPGMTKLMFQMEAYDPNKQKNDDDILDAAGMLIQTVPYFSYGYYQNENGEQVCQGLTWKDLVAAYSRPKSPRERLFAN